VSGEPLIRVDHEEGVTRIAFASPPVNELSHAFLGALEDAVAAVPADVRAVAVVSDVDRVFMAGGDIAFMAGAELERQREYVERVQAAFSAFERLPCPAVAGIDGACLGGGLELSLACDIRVVSAEAQLGQPEVRLGILPGAGGTQRLVRAAGQGVARDLLLTGRRISGEEAVRFGIASRLTRPGEASAAAVDLARELAGGAAEAVQAIKRLALAANDNTIEEGLAQELREWLAVRASRNAQEGLSAFLEKRSPAYG
jgi:enoyl-CoA hydratase/carnithine racemase